MKINLSSTVTPGSRVELIEDATWRLSIPPGVAGKYQLAQLDDYKNLPRKKFYWQPPLSFNLSARVSDGNVLGTWGFGFWNDPFSLTLGLQGSNRKLPALPNTAWFFYASPPNFLALNSSNPGSGMLATSFSSSKLPSCMLLLAGVLAPCMFRKPTAQILRRIARLWIKDAGCAISTDGTAWHNYEIRLFPDQVLFFLDDQLVFETGNVPNGQLGCVIWIDNQYASLTPGGTLKFGTLLAQDESWLEIKNPGITWL